MCHLKLPKLISDFLNFTSMFNVIKFKKGALALKMLALVAFTWFMLVGFGSLVKSQETELVMIQMIFRHGDRTPLHKYPNDPNDLSFWDKFGGYGVLTPNGKNQAYNYGSFLREKYADFLSERFNENQVIVKSTNYNRTIKTVQSILSTLYKPKDSDYWDEQLAPLPTPMATLDSIWNLPNCSKYDKLMSQVLKSDEFSEASNYYKDTIEAVNKYSGKDHDLMTLCSFADTVYTEKNYNLMLPEWVLEHYDKVQKSCDTLYHFSYRTPEMAKYVSGAILNDITMNLKRKVRRPVAPIELIMYSGHDTLVAPLIKQLELVENSTKPEFLASVIIELRRSKENGKFYVQALVKNNEVHEPIDLRKANIAGCDELCPFEDFERIVSNKIVKDLVSECASDMNNI